MGKDKTLGKWIIDRFFLWFGILFLAAGTIITTNDPAWLIVVLGGMLSSVLFGITRLVESLRRKLATGHWTQAAPERFSVARAVWYFLIAVGPPLLMAAYVDIIMETPGTHLVSTGFILTAIVAYSVSMIIDRTLVERRKRRESPGDATPRE